MWVFKPILKEVIWGGNRIIPFKNIDSDKQKVGESWEISGMSDNESIVAEGPDAGLSLTELIKKHKSELMGEKNYVKFGDRFPILVKFIDAAEDLSVQVHPSDEIAMKKEGKSGKHEMWYIMAANPEAKIANGFNVEINTEDYKDLVDSGNIVKVLNYIPIEPGDTFLIPPGRVHAIGKGTFLAEIQQSSDVTYRLYDYKRKDKDGKERPLHTDEAFEAINFKDINISKIPYLSNEDLPVNLVSTPHFTTNLWKIKNEVVRDYSEWDTFVIIICTKGNAELTTVSNTRKVKAGDIVLLPASCKNVTIVPEKEFEALETYIK